MLVAFDLSRLLKGGIFSFLGKFMSKKFKEVKLTGYGELVVSLIDRWGMVAGEPDGFDKTGRQKMKMLEPHEVVKRAYDLVNCFFDQSETAKLPCFHDKNEQDALLDLVNHILDEPGLSDNMRNLLTVFKKQRESEND